MRIEKVSPEVVNKLYKKTKLQQVLEEFMESDDLVVHIALLPGEYKNASSAQSSFYKAIQRLRYPVVARVLHKELYLLKLYSTKEGIHELA